MTPDAVLITGLKKMVIRECNVRDFKLEDMGDDEPIIGERLPLDSLDAVEIVAALERYFEIRLESAGASRKVFRSFRVMAEFVTANAGGEKIANFIARFH
jgi:acyl carrier protein